MTQNASSTITAVIDKNQGESLRITVGKKNGKTALRVNMEVLAVNNVNCAVASCSTEEIGMLLQETQGILTIVARKPQLPPGTLNTAVFTKRDPTEFVGIGLGSNSSNGQTTITSIKIESLAYNSDLQAGMIVKSVNNVDCSKKNAAEVKRLLVNATGTFTVLAQVDEDIPVAYAITPTSASSSAAGGRAGPRVGVSQQQGQKVERPPPPGLPQGGVWSTRKYAGKQTIISLVIACFCCGIFGPLVLCCPSDERDVYIINDKIYTSDGQLVGHCKPEGKTNGRVR